MMNLMDYYLSNENVYNRLKDEYDKYGKIIIAYDYDDTVFDFHNKKRTYENVIQLLKEFREYAYFIVYTASSDERYPEMIEYLDKNDIPHDSINENIPNINVPKGGKLYYNILLDDRAGLQNTYLHLCKLLDYIRNKERDTDVY